MTKNFKKFILLPHSKWLINSVVKYTLSVREVLGSITGPFMPAQCRQRLAAAATFLQGCVAQALSGEDGSRRPLHVSE